MVAANAARLGNLVVDGTDVLWTESRPSEGGRATIMRLRHLKPPEELLPAPHNARTTVHEYGGGAFTALRGAVYFSNFRDQRLYELRPGAAPTALSGAGSYRYAAMLVDERRRRLIAVEEEHRAGGETHNRLVGVSLDGARSILVEGTDFYASPRLSADGSRLSWLCWNHSDMPWEAAELWIGDLDGSGNVSNGRCVAGGPEESVFQPEWGALGELYFVSDRTGYGNLYRLREGSVEALCPRGAEFGKPQWQFEMSTYAPLRDGGIACSYFEGGRDHLAILRPDERRLSPIDVGYTELWAIRATPDRIVLAGACGSSPHAPERSGARWSMSKSS